jgi:SAM-dependent methyltransferase
MIELAACPVCDGASLRELYKANFHGGWEEAVPFFLTDRVRAVHGRIVRCEGCGFVFTTPQFAPEEYARIYERVAAAPAEAESRARAGSLRFERLRGRVASYATSGRFLELGAGDGSFLRVMEGNYEGVGFEIRRSELRRDGRIVSGDFLAWCAASGESFDFVAAWDVVEHLASLDAYMTAIASVLKPNGLFFATLPDISSLVARLSGETWNCILLEHLWYFSPVTYRRYLRRFGFETLRIDSFPRPVDLDTLALRAGQTYGTPALRLPKSLGRKVLSLPIGLMFAAARKVAA